MHSSGISRHSSHSQYLFCFSAGSAVKEKLIKSAKIRLLYLLGDDFENYEPGAMWEDAKMGLQHYSAWEKVAIITDVGWVRNMSKIIGYLIPGKVKVFNNNELEEAKQWVVN